MYYSLPNLNFPLLIECSWLTITHLSLRTKLAISSMLAHKARSCRKWRLKISTSLWCWLKIKWLFCQSMRRIIFMCLLCGTWSRKIMSVTKFLWLLMRNISWIWCCLRIRKCCAYVKIRLACIGYLISSFHFMIRFRFIRQSSKTLTKDP